MKKKTMGIIGLVLAAIAVALLWKYISDQNSLLKVDAITVHMQNVVDVYEEEAVVKSGETKSILSQISGEIVKKYAAENDVIKKGDLLLQLNTGDLEKQLRILEANKAGLLAKKQESDVSSVMNTTPSEYIFGLRSSMDAAKMAFSTAESDYASKEVLYAEGGISKLELDASRANLEQAKSSFETGRRRYEESVKQFETLKQEGKSEQEINAMFMESAKSQLDANISAIDAQIEQVKEQIGHGMIYTDADGIVTAFPASESTMVMAGSVVAIIKEGGGQKYLEVNVLTDVVPYIAVGDAVEVEFAFRGKKRLMAGVVHRINDFATENVSSLGLREYRVKVVVELVEDAAGNDLGEIKEGYNADVRFTLFNQNVLSVPIGAVFHFDGKDYCFVVQDNIASMREIFVSYTSSRFAVIEDGLQEGDVVIRSADNADLTNGVRVKAFTEP